MRYIGSKTATLPFLSSIVAARAPQATSLLDPFAGTCTVARHFKRLGFEVVTGDVLHLSHIFQVATVQIDTAPAFDALLNGGALIAREDNQSPAEHVIRHLNELPGQDGYIWRNFSPAGPAGRQFFTSANARRIDAVREAIQAWRDSELLRNEEHAFLLAALIQACDRVANTAGTYYAYLKTWTRKATVPLHLTASKIEPGQRSARCHRADARVVVRSEPTDVLYLDPPYNERNYERYYHLPESLARGGTPEVRGRSGTPVDVVPCSDFCRPSAARDALATLCRTACAKHILIHYAADGLVSHADILDMLSECGRVRWDEIDVRGYASRAGAAMKARHRIYWCDVSGRA